MTSDQEWAETWAAVGRLQLAQCRRLQELMEEGIAAGLPVIEWTVQGLGALLGRPHHPDPRTRRAEFDAWADHLGAERLPQAGLGSGSVRLRAVVNPQGHEIPDAVLLADIHDAGQPFPGDQVMRLRFDDVEQLLGARQPATGGPAAAAAAVDPRVLGGGAQPVRRRDIEERLRTLRAADPDSTEGTDK
ncbi:hypothetical protein [Streptomyces sp. NPDC002172]